MNNKKTFRFEIAGAVLIAAAMAATAMAQQFVYKAPTAADWAALAKLPDFSGVWERGGGGGGGQPAKLFSVDFRVGASRLRVFFPGRGITTISTCTHRWGTNRPLTMNAEPRRTLVSTEAREDPGT